MPAGNTAKILLLDIETAPSRVYTWGLFNQTIALSQIEEPGYTLCWAAKWLGKRKMMFSSLYQDGRAQMLSQIYGLLADADIVIHYNGSSFDIPILNQEFLRDGETPPAPFKEIDLLKTCRSRFRFLSNKMDFVIRFLGEEGKTPHKGMALWTGCLANDPVSWGMMEKYNKRDVVILERLYKKLLPWIQPHPNLALYNNNGIPRPECPNCAGSSMQARGKYRTQTMVYQRYICLDCGKWTRSRLNEVGKEKLRDIRVGVK